MLLISSLSSILSTETVVATGLPPSSSNPFPSNSSTNQDLNPTLSITVNDPEEDNMTITWSTNATTSDWIGVNSSNLDSFCGETFSSLAGALDGTNKWYHNVNHVHWFILDLGAPYSIEKLRGRSEETLDPINVSIYVSETNSSWGTPVVTNISTWQDTTIWQEVDTTDKIGRYIKVEISETESALNHIKWGNSPYMTIFDVYGKCIWQTIGTNSSVLNGTYYQTTSIFSRYNTTYWWKVNVSDGTNYSESIYHFTTEKLLVPQVATKGSTSVEETNATLHGYLQDEGNNVTTCGFWWDNDSGTPYANNHSVGTVSEGNTFSYNVSSLSMGQLYCFRAWAKNSGWFNGTANELTFLTKPNTTYNLYANAYSGSQINLTWNKGSGANKTLIRRKTNSYPNNITDGTLVYNDTGTSYSNTGLTATTTYYYRAWSYTNWTYNSTTLQQWSNTYSNATTTTKAASMPIVVTSASTDVEETKATLQGYLQDDGGEPCTVRFEYGTTTNYGTNTTNQTKNTNNEFSAEISNLTVGQLYHYRAYTNNTAGSNTGSDKTLLTKPDAPTNLTATTQSTSQIDLTWTKGIGANKTHIRRKTNSYPNNITDGTQIYNDTGRSYSNTGLSASTKYYYRAWSYTKWTYGSTTLHQWSDGNDSDTATTSSGGSGGGTPTTPPEEPEPDENEPPVADTGGPYSGFVNESINFIGFESSDSDGTIVNYTWDFGDNTIGYGMNITHIFTKVGIYIVTLTVTDNDGATNENTANVTITEEEGDEEGFLFDVEVDLTTDSVYENESINTLITLINVGEPGLVNGTVNYTIYKGVEVVWSETENVSVLGQKTFNKIISTAGLSSGSYIYEVVYSYGGGQTASAQASFTVKPKSIPSSKGASSWNPTTIAILIVVIIALFAVLLFWFFKIR